tara:strand:- start:674 stop:1174 length:501 start_codon:yes stop_codon:yes gene_type:complete
MPRKRKTNISIIFLLVGVFICTNIPADISGPALVVDGDTIAINGLKIRLFGIDAPEKDQICLEHRMEWRCGYSALDTLRKWTDTKEVRCIKKGKDVYGRLIAECFVNGYNLNARLVHEGWALAYRHYTQKYISQENSAELEKRGIWKGRFIVPWKWRKGERFSSDE